MANKPEIRRAAVLGAGVMGSQIAAMLANAGLQVDLLDVPDEAGKASRAQQGVEGVQRGRSPALYDPALAGQIAPGTFEEAGGLAEADWVIEAVVEDSAVKKDLYSRLAGQLKSGAVLSSNTSGLAVNDLAAGLAPDMRARFLGVHFFNPPRQMKLVEIVPAAETAPETVERVRRFVEDELGKGTVLCRDTPNFIANRLGVFALMDVLHRMGDRPVEQVDALTGPLLGRPKSATLRLADIIGLDTLVQVARTAYDKAPADPWRAVFAAPSFLKDMLKEGRVGAKSGGGFYRKAAGGIESYDCATAAYSPQQKTEIGPLAGSVRLRPWSKRLDAVWQAEGAEADFVRGHLLAVLFYAVYHAADIAESVADIDRAMRWGFNWEAGPFEIWDALGTQAVLSAGAKAGLAPPDWLATAVEEGRFSGFYQQHAPYRPQEQAYGQPTVRTESSWEQAADAFEQVGGAYAVRQDEVGVVVLRGTLNVLGQETLELLHRVLNTNDLEALVLTGAGGHFSAGADLKYMAGLVADKKWADLDAFVLAFQQTAMAIRTAAKPVVAAAGGLVLGGGCEFCLAAAGRVWAAESRPGLVESQVGLLPGGGGCKEMLRRHGPDLGEAFDLLLEGAILDNAYQGRRRGLVMVGDPILMNGKRVVPQALALARKVAESYQVPSVDSLEIGGGAERQRLLARLEGREDLSQHDRRVGEAIAGVLSGGDGPARRVGEWHVLDLEREVFLQLCGTPETQARIAHMLETGKPLKN